MKSMAIQMTKNLKATGNVNGPNTMKNEMPSNMTGLNSNLSDIDEGVGYQDREIPRPKTTFENPHLVQKNSNDSYNYNNNSPMSAPNRTQNNNMSTFYNNTAEDDLIRKVDSMLSTNQSRMRKEDINLKSLFNIKDGSQYGGNGGGGGKEVKSFLQSELYNANQQAFIRMSSDIVKDLKKVIFFDK